ncbi:MAG: alpha-glucan family phosphorylase [Rikenellaceae bacterium]
MKSKSKKGSKSALDNLFEVSWEVCNKVGGIHTVISTKALTVSQIYADKYIAIGPDLSKDGGNSEFEEDLELLKSWRKSLASDGVRVRIGRWKIAGAPIVVLVDFTSFFSRKDEIMRQMWDNYRVDSLSGEWDYVESMLFGYAAGVVIASYVDIFCSSVDRVAAHFHEWMTASGGLYLRDRSPYVATLFTTHATVLGRSIAGNYLPLYNDMQSYNGDDMARQFNVVAKHSLEKAAATYHDAFLTVSDLTAVECRELLGHSVDMVTPNGFEDDFVWQGDEFLHKRSVARQKMIRIATAMFGVEYANEPLIVGTSGRYEFRNKGIDLLLDAAKQLAENDALERDILLYITVPAGDKGARKDLLARIEDMSQPLDESQNRFITHYIDNPQSDPILNSIRGSILESTNSRVKVIFVPAYLNKDTELFNCDYYELLVGNDLTVYASYYEPWGYTPLESAAFSVPTITTTLTGFGVWSKSLQSDTLGIEVIERDDYNDSDVVSAIADSILRFSKLGIDELCKACESASDVARTALWSNLFAKYEQAYALAVEKSLQRSQRIIHTIPAASDGVVKGLNSQRRCSVEQPNWCRVMVEKSLPERLHALEELSRNLWWSWNADARKLFKYIDEALWSEVCRNPIILLDRISQERLLELESDKDFLESLDLIHAKFKLYMDEPANDQTSVAYFSMEYGLHSSLKIYSGGLGVLAGDYLKEASDRNVPMVAVGLLYRYGYFTQRLSSSGEQEASYEPQNFDKLPISPLRDKDGVWVTIQLTLPGRMLSARVWRCQVGRRDLLLMDTDYEDNLPEDRAITHHLYGGDWENRLKQEMLLGVGGIRVLKAVGIDQEIYHCNEGHAAFIGVERMRSLIRESHLSFTEAMEVVRSTSLFTTHTPVPAGHDAFPESMIRQYMSHYPACLGISWEQYMQLGKIDVHDANERFSMSVLACNLSQEVNGVSWLHGEVSKEILGDMWPGYFKSELHIGYVTNGVHFPTWIASSMRRLYAKYFEDSFSGHSYNIGGWQAAKDIPDAELWEVRRHLKRRLIDYICNRYKNPSSVRFDSPSQIIRIMEGLRSDVLTIGFARRFATYKRAALLFTDLDRLDSIVNNGTRPVQFIFAGKAHPNDKPGQDLIKRIVEVSLMPQFVGKILFLQNYDMELARQMVHGVDVWLNTPTRPLEASGTSGEKCVMNGVLQFSVLDGWWVEGYREDAGWMLPMERSFEDQNFQNELDAERIYTTIEDHIAPLYYSSKERGDDTPHEWLQYVKCCIADVASNFTTNRMLIDYEERFYDKLGERGKWVRSADFANARTLAGWKQHIYENWDSVKVVDVQRATMQSEAIFVGHQYHFEATVNIGKLSASEVGAELVVANQLECGERAEVVECFELSVVSQDGSLVNYAINYKPSKSGSFDLSLRLFPKSDMLSSRMDLPLVKWV